jgi:WD40 repeat protein
MLLTGSSDGTAAVWDVVSGRRLKRVNLNGEALAVCFLPRLRGFLTLASDAILRTWDLQGNPLGAVEEVVLPVALSSDGSTLMALSSDRKPVRINLDTMKKTRDGSFGCVGDSLRFARDWKHFYSVRDGTRIQRWAKSTGRSEGAFRDLGVKVTAFAPTASEDRIVAGMETGELVIYGVGSGLNVATLRGHTATVKALSDGADENLWVSGSDDCSLRVWDLSRQECLAILEGHASPIRSVTIFANGSMIASGGSDGSVRLWGLEWEVSGPNRDG